MASSVPKTSQCTNKVLTDSPLLVPEYPSWLMNSGCHTDDETLHLQSKQVKFQGEMIDCLSIYINQFTDEVISETNFLGASENDFWAIEHHSYKSCT